MGKGSFLGLVVHLMSCLEGRHHVISTKRAKKTLWQTTENLKPTHLLSRLDLIVSAVFHVPEASSLSSSGRLWKTRPELGDPVGKEQTVGVA